MAAFSAEFDGFVLLDEFDHTPGSPAVGVPASSGYLQVPQSQPQHADHYLASPMKNEYMPADPYSLPAPASVPVPAPASVQAFSASIVSWDRKMVPEYPGSHPSKHPAQMKEAVVYVVELNLLGRKWQVERRHTQFVTLSDFLSELAPFVIQVPLPPTFAQTWFSTPEELADQRIQPLRAFVEQIVSCRPLLSLYEVQDFFDIVPKPWQCLTDPVFADPYAQGLFYLKIVEATELPLVQRQSPSSYIRSGQTTSLLDVRRHEHVECQTFSDSTAPRWFEEQIYKIPNRSEPVRLQARHSQGLSSLLLGQLQLDLRSFQPYTLYDVWLPLEQGHPKATPALDTDRPRLHVLAHYFPLPVDKAEAHKLPDFRVQIPRRKYFPGQVVAGFLVCNVSKLLSAMRVTLDLKGVEKTHFTKKEGKNTKDLHAERVLVHQTMLLWSAPPGTEHLPPGSYVWPFEFTLPARLPPTFTSKHAWIKYFLHAEVHRPGAFTFNKRTELPFKVLAPFTSPTPLPHVYGRAAPLPFRSADQVVDISAHLAHDIAIIGEPTQLTVNIANRTTHNLLNCSVALHTKITAHARNRRKHFGLLHPLSRLEGAGWPIVPGESRQFTLTFTVSKQAQPSLPTDLCQLVHVDNVVEIVCDISGFLTGKVSIDVPVILSHRLPTPEMWHSTPPITHLPAFQKISAYGLCLPNFAASMFSPTAPLPAPEAPLAQIAPHELIPQPQLQPQPGSYFSPDFQAQMPAFDFPSFHEAS